MRYGMPLDAIPLWLLFFAAVIAIGISLETGYRFGRRRRRLFTNEETHVSGMAATQLGLLAFLLAFTFGIATTTYGDRREALLDEANAIGTLHLRAAMLPEARRDRLRSSLKEYVDVRVAAVSRSRLEAGIARSGELHEEMWRQAIEAAAADPNSLAVELVVRSLNDVIDKHARRLSAGLRSRVPMPTWMVLFTVAVLSLGTMGYAGGVAGAVRSPAAVIVAVSFALVLWMVADLDRPGEGLLRVGQQPLLDLQAEMARSDG